MKPSLIIAGIAVAGATAIVVFPRMLAGRTAAPFRARLDASEDGNHHITRSLGEALQCRLTWPRTESTTDGICTFEFLDFEHADSIQSGTLYQLEAPTGKVVVEWTESIIESGGPTSTDYVALLETQRDDGYSVSADGGVGISVDGMSADEEKPFYLVLRDSAGVVVQEVIFGPLAEGAARVFATKYDLDQIRGDE